MKKTDENIEQFHFPQKLHLQRSGFSHPFIPP